MEKKKNVQEANDLFFSLVDDPNKKETESGCLPL